MPKTPRNVGLLILLAAGTLTASPAAAQEDRPMCGGTITLPSPPSVAVQAHERAVSDNGRLGFVCPLPARADGVSYRLMRTTPGPANLDAYFYEDDEGAIGEGCHTIVSRDSQPLFDDPAPLGELLTYVDARVEEGTICPGEQEARWAVIVLRTGVTQNFEFDWRSGPR